MAATGARVSELIMIKVEHVKTGYIDLYTKGGKIRRLYIPISLKEECLQWLKDKNVVSGFIFLNRYGNRITTRGVSGQLKKYAAKYGLDLKVIYCCGQEKLKREGQANYKNLRIKASFKRREIVIK